MGRIRAAVNTNLWLRQGGGAALTSANANDFKYLRLWQDTAHPPTSPRHPSRLIFYHLRRKTDAGPVPGFAFVYTGARFQRSRRNLTFPPNFQPVLKNNWLHEALKLNLVSLCQRLLSFPSPLMRSRPGKTNLRLPNTQDEAISEIIGLLFGHIKRGRIAPKWLLPNRAFHNMIRDMRDVLPVLSASGHRFRPLFCANVSKPRSVIGVESLCGRYAARIDCTRCHG